MPKVHFTPHLRRYFPELSTLDVPARTVAELVGELDARHRGLAGYLIDDRGALRQHVVIFVDRVAVRDREGLSDAVAPHSEVHVFQALSGG